MFCDWSAGGNLCPQSILGSSTCELPRLGKLLAGLFRTAMAVVDIYIYIYIVKVVLFMVCFFTVLTRAVFLL